MTTIQTGYIGNNAREITDEFTVRIVDKGNRSLEAIQISHPKSKNTLYIKDREMALALIDQLNLLTLELQDSACWSCVGNAAKGDLP